VSARLPITACVLTLNEERNLPDCLDSVRFCEEIVVVDSFSTDRTLEVARKHTDRLFQRAWEGFAAQRSFAITQARHDWVLVIDADERATPELEAAIRTIFASDPGAGRASGYLIPRRTFYLGRWIDHGDWVPDQVLRLFDRRVARVVGSDPHDRIEVSGRTGRIGARLVHYGFRDLSHHLATTDAYSRVAAAEMRRAGRRFRWWDLVLRPFARFVKGYLLKRGFLDGIPGLAVAIGTSHYVFVKYLKLYELERGLDAPRDGGPPPTRPPGA
jgi:glycosyltransferase involved in cell wall biosynthesis